MKVRASRKSVFELDLGRDGPLTATSEEAVVAHLAWMVRESARECKPLEIDFEACARMAVELQDPYDEDGESMWARNAGAA